MVHACTRARTHMQVRLQSPAPEGVSHPAGRLPPLGASLREVMPLPEPCNPVPSSWADGLPEGAMSFRTHSSPRPVWTGRCRAIKEAFPLLTMCGLGGDLELLEDSTPGDMTTSRASIGANTKAGYPGQPPQSGAPHLPVVALRTQMQTKCKTAQAAGSRYGF